MVASLDPKSLVPVGSYNMPAVRPRQSGAVQPVEDRTPQQSAREFVESLPADVRERVARSNQNQYQKNSYQQTDQAEQSDVESKIAAQTVANEESIRKRETTKRVYSAPVIAAGVTLLQAQLSVGDFESASASFSSLQHNRLHDYYVQAGAQTGGQRAAFDAGIRQAEQEQKTLIVPPAVSTVNSIA